MCAIFVLTFTLARNFFSSCCRFLKFRASGLTRLKQKKTFRVEPRANFSINFTQTKNVISSLSVTEVFSPLARLYLVVTLQPDLKTV